MTEPQRKDNELSRVYSEGAWPEPRRQIDDAILAASRRAARARHPVLHRWGPPFALAATVVVGVSLAVMVSEQESLEEVRDFFRDSGRAAEQPAPPQKKREAAPAAPKVDAAPKSETAPRTAAPPSTELFASPMGPDHRPPAPKAAPAPKAGAVPPAALAKRPQQSPPPAAAKSPAPQALTGRLAAPAPDPQRADRIRRELDQLEEKRAPASPPQAEEKPQAAPSSASVSDVRGLAASPVARSPEAWLEDIRRLKEQGRTADAERELGEFRKRYPGYRVPDDLR